MHRGLRCLTESNNALSEKKSHRRIHAMHTAMFYLQIVYLRGFMDCFDLYTTKIMHCIAWRTHAGSWLADCAVCPPSRKSAKETDRGSGPREPDSMWSWDYHDKWCIAVYDVSLNQTTHFVKIIKIIIKSHRRMHGDVLFADRLPERVPGLLWYV